MTMKTQAPSARSVAARVVGRVLFEQAYTAAALDAELSRTAQLDARERGLATELSYGVLRTRPALEARLKRYMATGVKDETTLVHLLVAAYQLLILERVPAFAAVNAAVEAVRLERGPRMAGFVNAVLRKLSSGGERLSMAAALRESAPAWLHERLRGAVGEEEALALLGADGVMPGVAVRLVAGRPVPEWLATAPVGKVSPRARRLERLGDLRKRPGYAEGAFVVQEEGAQAIALLLGARGGERVLDACAGRGQKTSLLVEQVGAAGRVWAADLYPAKLDALGRELERLALPLPERAAVDWTAGTAQVPADFDRVLVDAPCTGTGTLRHRPEIVSRLDAADPGRLAQLATQILRAAATRARPGGRVVFAVCSVLEEEGEGVVAQVSDLLEPCPFDAPELVGRIDAQGHSLRLLPGRDGTDGYFVASFARRA